MTAARALQIDDWVVHRPNVVRSVMARVPGVDAEEATSRALEKMIRIVSGGGTITDPAPYWRRAAVNEAISMTRESGRATLVEDDTLEALTPPAAGAELDAERHADVAMLRTALAALAAEDREILLERHVHDRAVSDIADGLGVRPHAVTMRLRRAEERLAGAFAAAHAQAVNEPECRATRAAMHDYLKDRLLPRRRGRVEAHMDSCADCTRAFMDVREVSWMLRDLGQHLVAAAVATGTLGAAVGAGAASGAGAAGAAGGAGGGAAGGRRLGTKEKVLLAVAAAVVVGGGAAVGVGLLAADQGRPPAAESLQDGGGSGDGSGGGPAAGSAAGSGTGSGTGTDDAGTDDAGTDDAGTDGAVGPGAGAGAGDGGQDGAGTGTGDGATVDGPAAGGDGADEPGGDGPGENGPGANSSGTNSDGEAADGDAADGGSSSADPGSAGGSTGVGAAVRDVLASLGIGDGTPAERAGEDAGRGSGGLDDGRAGTTAPGDDPGGAADAGNDGQDAGDDGTGADGADPEGPAAADGALPRLGDGLMEWFGRLGGAGLPAFLVIVFLLWLWERWNRSESS